MKYRVCKLILSSRSFNLFTIDSIQPIDTPRICRIFLKKDKSFTRFLPVRYTILAPKAIPPGFVDGMKATEKLVEALNLEENEFRMGYSKVC